MSTAKAVPSNIAILKLPLPIGSSCNNSTYNASYNDLDNRSKKSNTKASSPVRNGSQPAQQGGKSLKTSPLKGQKSPNSATTDAKSPIKNQKGATNDPKKISRAGTLNVDKSATKDGQKSPKKGAKEPEIAKVEEEDDGSLKAEEIKERLYKLFQYYTTFGERNNVGYLKSHRFTKMMVDAEVRDDALNQSSLDLLFVGELKHSGNLKFDKFLGLLSRTARVKYEAEADEAEALDKLLKEHMFPLYEKIFKDGDIGGDVEEEEDTVLEEGTKMVFNEVDGTLKGIFQTYFPFEIQSGQDPQVFRQRMENALFMFLRDFGMCPGLISKGAAFAAWTEVMRTPLEVSAELNQSALDQSTLDGKGKKNKKPNEKDLPFSFEKFKMYLVRLASLAHQTQVQNQSLYHNQSFAQNPNQSQVMSPGGFGFTPAHNMGFTPAHGMGFTPAHNMGFSPKNPGFSPSNFGFTPSHFNQTMGSEFKASQLDKTTQLLERMDIAFRTLSTEKKAGIPTKAGTKQTLLVSAEAVNKINSYLKTQESFLLGGAGGNRKGKGKGQKAKTVIVTTGTRYEDYGILDEDLIILFEKHYYNLLKVFQYYCSFGEPLNSTRLHAFKFTKLLKEAGLLQFSTNTAYPEAGFRILQGISPAAGAPTITVADADIIVAGLSGPKIVRELNEKKMNYDPNVETPFIGYLNYLYKNNPLNLATQNKLEYEAFLKGIEVVAKKLFPDLTLAKAAAKIIEKNLLKLEKEISQVQKTTGSKPLKVLVDLLQDMKIVEFLGTVHKSMMLYYKFYADSKGMMNIEKFMQFCRDFGVFPHLVTKGKLCTFFHALAGVRSQAEESESGEFLAKKLIY